ncbi:nodulation protein [Halobacteriales archaeon SW_7_71_33]|nr:MAG: nodulation protein [Halobacteriales archaeon SW_7_71_33]
MASRQQFPDYVEVDYEAGAGEDPEDYPGTARKIEKAIEVVHEGLTEYERPAVMWTGGKDSTLTLYLVKEVVEEYDLETPPTVFIDHFQHFDELLSFVDRWADRWDQEVLFARNDDVGDYVDAHDLGPGDEIPVAELSEHNRHHIRWDEQEGRADETFFSSRHDPEVYPPHDRIQPILQFAEADVWDAFWSYVVPESVPDYPEGHVPQDYDDLPDGVTHADLPISPKYFEGYRSLGSEISTERSDQKPAWLQDLSTEERAGRAQDKEDLMERLRDLGYM